MSGTAISVPADFPVHRITGYGALWTARPGDTVTPLTVPGVPPLDVAALFAPPAA